MSSSKCSFTSICGIFLPLNPSTTTVYARSAFYPSLRFTLSLLSAFYTVFILLLVRSPQSAFYTDRISHTFFHLRVVLRQLFDTVNGKCQKSKKTVSDSNYLRCHALKNRVLGMPDNLNFFLTMQLYRSQGCDPRALLTAICTLRVLSCCLLVCLFCCLF